MTPRLRPLILLVTSGGLAVVGGALHTLLVRLPPALETGVLWYTLLLVVAILSEMRPVPFTLGRASKDESFSITIILLVLFAFGWPAAVLLAVAAVVVADTQASKPYYKVLFNGSMYALATAAAGLTYQLGHSHPGMLQGALSPVWIDTAMRFAAGGMWYLVNAALLMLVLARVQGVPLTQMFVWGLRDSAGVNLALISIGTAMSLLWQLHPVIPVILVPAILMAKSGYQGYTRLRTEAEAMLAALADVLDLRDHTTGKHSQRVAEMSYALARELALPEEQALALQSVARVHDVGKIAVRDAVLLKRGSLSLQERQEIQSHVEAGGQILSHLSVYKPHLPILLQHHEWLDGSGYPYGLRAEQIGAGARILAVCDAYDTMTSERPYRTALSREAAMAELYRQAGSQFDLHVVEALERWLIRERRLRPDWRLLAAPPTAAFLSAVGGGEGTGLEQGQAGERDQARGVGGLPVPEQASPHGFQDAQGHVHC
ncbi:MAG: HD-GYP domain-containing protein [Armatimonadota bacterium]|nr:HD-GYP domain-containing protein [Armatimonadota bacterium]MDR7427467.1 HD-GYP domain-containing protein [Armatimonadota bacterium]MDR7463827.1 HD-GYP domain-containing protein [Armatimonadota bacterium]MDR7469973.1 HD-GYP domain-containing protein [Armatimonadota bacterium]MDR7474479.1 HD-GYP domain-containing protein [Armatimonadota bacterium]